MKVRDPQPFVNNIDWILFDQMRAQSTNTPSASIEYSEPTPIRHMSAISVEFDISVESALPMTITGKIQKFGDSVDTDMVFYFLH